MTTTPTWRSTVDNLPSGEAYERVVCEIADQQFEIYGLYMQKNETGRNASTHPTPVRTKKTWGPFRARSSVPFIILLIFSTPAAIQHCWRNLFLR